MATSRFRRSLAAGVIGLAALGGAAGITGVASAGSSAGGTGASHPSKAAAMAQLSAEQRSCLVDAGLSRPTGRPTVEQTQALRAAAAKCGIAVGRPAGVNPGNVTSHPSVGAFIGRLSADQRACLTSSGLTRPDGRPSADQIQAIRDAAAACGIAIPARG